MKILHTSDWHLGQNFMGQSREKEHRAFLLWLKEKIVSMKVDILIVAGDIFDTGTPPNYALELYYRFLTQLLNTPCKTIIILGGNHDSVSTLQTSSTLLKELNIYVVARGDQSEHRVIECHKNGKLQVIICAVPFLRDTVIRKSISGESSKEKEKSLNFEIEAYYREIHQEALTLKGDREIPIIGTGHLTTIGGRSSDSERDIYIGNSRNIPSDFLTELFDYTALGHLHHAQKIYSEYVRYSGSPIPLSFSEADKEKSVTLISFEQKELTVTLLPIPLYRPFYRLKGDKKMLKQQLKAIKKKYGWIEIEVNDENSYATLQEVHEYANELGLTILARKLPQKEASTYQEKNRITLKDITPYEVFEKRLALDKIQDIELKEALENLFKTIETEISTV